MGAGLSGGASAGLACGCGMARLVCKQLLIAYVCGYWAVWRCLPCEACLQMWDGSCVCVCVWIKYLSGC